jgi:hypothetical protein
MKWFRILGVVAVVYLVSGGATNAGAQVTPVDELNQKIHKEFGLVGQWTITKMDISRSFAGAAGAAQASYDIGSSVVEGMFEVQSGGNVVGQGHAAYRVRASAGTSTKIPVPFGIGGLLNAMPVGAVAALAPDDDGVRSFRFTGQANLAGRTISLNAFQPSGKPLKLLIQPTGAHQDFTLWPPMTNVSPTATATEGANLVLRASGNVSGISVAIEARKFVDVQGLFQMLVNTMARCGCGTKAVVPCPSPTASLSTPQRQTLQHRLSPSTAPPVRPDAP